MTRRLIALWIASVVVALAAGFALAQLPTTEDEFQNLNLALKTLCSTQLVVRESITVTARRSDFGTNWESNHTDGFGTYRRGRIVGAR